MIRDGDAVRVRGGEKDRRPGVVLRILADGRLFVLWGTGTLRPDKPHVAVRPETPAGTTLRLEKQTYFYPGNITICAAEKVDRLGVQCPPSLLIALQKLMGQM